MILLVDVGNRRLKWTSADQVSEPAPAWDWRAGSWRETLASIWKDLAPTALVGCNVAGTAVQAEIDAYCRDVWGVEPQWLRSTAECRGLHNCYPRPEQLGADRWAAMLGALQLSCLPALVVDCGTAVTVDLIDAQGRHLGGAIWPGIRTMRESLRTSAANLDIDPGDRMDFADNTAAAIAGGSVQALIGGIARYQELASKRLGADCPLLLCGGDAELVMGELGPDLRYEPNLVMLGLMRGFEVT